ERSHLDEKREPDGYSELQVAPEGGQVGPGPAAEDAKRRVERVLRAIDPGEREDQPARERGCDRAARTAELGRAQRPANEQGEERSPGGAIDEVESHGRA